MNHEELMKVARDLVKNQLGVDPTLLGNAKIIDAVVVYFGKSKDPRMEVVLNGENGAFISATSTPDFEIRKK